MGAGMEETYQLTGALKYLPFGKHVAVVTDARFSGVSTGACIGHVSPEALAGGPVGKLRDGDLIEIVSTAIRSTARSISSAKGRRRGRRSRRAHSRVAHAANRSRARPALPDDTRIWAALQDVSGGTWGGAVYDVDAILKAIAAGKKAGGGGDRS